MKRLHPRVERIGRALCAAILLLAAAHGRPADLALTFSTARVPPCGLASAEVILPIPAADADDVRLVSSHPALRVPDRLRVAPGDSRAAFLALASPVRSPTVVRVIAIWGLEAATARLTLLPAPAWTIEDLGDLGGGESRATAIAADGRVGGVSLTAAGTAHGFVTAEGDLADIAPDATGEVHVAAINSVGQVAGWRIDTAGRAQAFFTDPAGVPRSIAIFGAESSRSLAINASGEVAGFFTTAAREDRAFWMAEGGAVTDLGTFEGGAASYAFALTDDGAVAGFGDAGRRAYAFLTHPGERLAGAARIGPHARAYAVNADGALAGEVFNEGDGLFHGFRARPGEPMEDLGALNGWDVAALGINGRGEIVGKAYDFAGPDQRAVYYSDSRGLCDLNDLIAPGAGWTLAAATGINDEGQIAGYGVREGRVRAFRLKPVVPPTLYGDADGSGAVEVDDAVCALEAAGGLRVLSAWRETDVWPAPSCAVGGVGDGVVEIADALRVLRRIRGAEPVWP